jgi:hypothetical protein
MADQSAGGAATKVLGALVSAAVGGLTWLAGATGVIGTLWAAVLGLLGAIGAPVAVLIYRRYVGVLGAGGRPKGSPARLAYDELRESLSGGNMPARLYAKSLSAFLDAIDRFFGDAGKADQTLFPRAFGLNTPAPLWTAPAFDRCLLLALIYPIVALIIIWAISGHVGPAEAALGLAPNISPWRRGLTVAGVLTVAGFAWADRVTARPKSFGGTVVRASTIGLKASIVAFVIAVALTGVVAGAFVVAFVGVLAFAGVVAFAGVFAFAGAVVVAFAVAVAVAFAFAVALPVAFAGASARLFAVALIAGGILVVVIVIVVTVVVDLLNERAIAQRWHGVFLSLFLPAMIIACLMAANLLSSLKMWEVSGPLLLFLGLLSLLNAPFDWASLGLTRALLRRGLELAGWWPYLLAIADAALAALIVAALALTMVVGVQAFDALAQHSGGTAILPLDALFEGIATHPADPEYWWLYALLLTTVLPSMVNLMIGGASLLRGLPGLPLVMLRKLPAGKAVPDFDRNWIALVLTLQIVGGAVLGIAAQALLIVGIIGHVMPWFGLGLLDMARNVAAFNLPSRVGQLLGGSL